MAEPGTEAGDVFDLDRLRQIIELMKEHDLGQVDLRQGEQRIALRRGSQYIPPPPPPPPPPRPAGEARPIAPAAGPAPAVEVAENVLFVKSPMVGTYYSRPNPSAGPFVKVGDHIQATTTVCIIEAMKVFNEIPAEVAGKIVAALVEDGEPVEFGQNLYKVEKTK